MQNCTIIFSTEIACILLLPSKNRNLNIGLDREGARDPINDLPLFPRFAWNEKELVCLKEK